MESIKITPSIEQNKLWMLYWNITFFSVLIPLIFLFIFVLEPGKIVVAIFLGLWIIFTIPLFFYISAYFKTLYYEIQEDAIISKRGVFFKKHVTVPYRKITNVDLMQGPLQRKRQIGIVNVQTAGAGGAQGVRPELRIVGVKDFDKIKDTIMDRVKEIRTTKVMSEKEDSNLKEKPEVLIQILEELKSIRKTLEKN